MIVSNVIDILGSLIGIESQIIFWSFLYEIEFRNYFFFEIILNIMFRWWSSTKNEESATPIEVLGTITNTTIGVATTIIILHYVVHRYFQTPLLAHSMT